jgi:hypothetical protein
VGSVKRELHALRILATVAINRFVFNPKKALPTSYWTQLKVHSASLGARSSK